MRISERASSGPLWQRFKLRLKFFPPAQQKKFSGVQMSVVILGAQSRQSSRSLGSTRCRNGRLFVTQKPRLRPPALAFANHRPGQKPTQAKVVGPAWPGFFWPGLARLLASSRSRHITIHGPLQGSRSRYGGTGIQQGAEQAPSNY